MKISPLLSRATLDIYAMTGKHINQMKPETLTMIRKAEGQSISAFAKRLGISRNTLGLYEAGASRIPPYIALAVTAIYRRLEIME
jgi:DNA-binding transcriptional regulator YiaG